MQRAEFSWPPRWEGGRARTHLLSICIRWHPGIHTMVLYTTGGILRDASDASKKSVQNARMWMHTCFNEFLTRKTLHRGHYEGSCKNRASNSSEKRARGGSSNEVHCAGRVGEEGVGRGRGWGRRWVRLQGRMPREPSCSDFILGACSRRARPWIRLATASIQSVGLPCNCSGITPSG